MLTCVFGCVADLVKVGQDNAALQILHSMLLTRRYRTWQPTHEQIMLLYIQLAVDNNKNAKDGLLQYRIICQTAQTDSLQMIIRKFCELAEARTTAALGTNTPLPFRARRTYRPSCV